MSTTSVSPRKATSPPRKGAKALWIAAGAVAILSYIGIAPRIAASRKLQGSLEAQTAARPLVSVAQLNPDTGEADLTLPSTIQAIQETSLSARVNGYLRQRFVDIGSKVKAGQVLATIEAPEIDQQYSEAQAEEMKSSADSRQAVADVSRLRAAASAADSQVAAANSLLEEDAADVVHSRAKLSEAKGAESEAAAVLQQTMKNLEAKKADLGRAKSRLTLAHKTYTRWQELMKGGAVSGQDLDEAEEGFQSSQGQVEGAQADVLAASAQVEAARAALTARTGDVAGAGADIVASKQKVQAARSAVNAAKSNASAADSAVQAGMAGIGAANANVQSNQANVARVASLRAFENIVAPFSGVITARNVDVGDLISPPAGGQSTNDQTNPVSKSGLFGIAKTDQLRIQVNVPEADVENVREGQRADVTIPELPNRTFVGDVFHTSGAVDAASRTELVEIRVENSDAVLKPGMYAQVTFKNTATGARVQIPATAMIFDAKGTRVATVTPEDTIHFVPVKLGRDLGDTIEIVSGLMGHERVITNPDDSLKEGAKVQVASAKSNL